MFRSNMDIQFILDPYSCCSYVVDYINKADRGLSKTLEEVYNKHKDDSALTAFDMLRSLASTYYNSSEISAQESAYNILSIRMSEASTRTKFVPTNRPEHRMHILKNQQTLGQLEPTSKEIFEAGLADHYVQRPDCLDGMNLALFAAYFDVSKKNPSRSRNSNSSSTENDDDEINEDDMDTSEDADADADADGINEDAINEDDMQVVEDNVDSGDAVVGGVNGDTINPETSTTGDEQEENSRININNDPDLIHSIASGTVFELKNKSRFLKRRTKPLVIRYYPSNIKVDREDYFRILLMLFKPWRNEASNLLNANCEEIFNQYQDSILEAKNEFCRINDTDLNSYMELLSDNQENDLEGNDEEDDKNGSGGGAHNALNANEDFRRYIIDLDDSQEGNYHRTTDLKNELSPNSGNDTHGQTYLEKMAVPGMLGDDEYYQLVSRLNVKQRDYLTQIVNYIRYNKDRSIHQFFNNDNINQASNFTFDPFYHMVSGSAGVGKSMLINALYKTFIREFDRNRDRDMTTPSVLLCAPTGKAAFNISGITLHHAFQLPCSQLGKNKGVMTKLSRDVAHSMSVALRDLQVVIIDEVSMVGDRNFGYIDKRLRDIFDRELSFGGKSIILFGDFRQLPPVGSKSIYSSKAEFGDCIISALLSTNLWYLFKVHTLDQIMRQRNDLNFAVALNNMAIGTMTPADITLLQSRVLPLTSSQLRQVNLKELVLGYLNSNELVQSRPICLFFTNNNVKEGNNKLLASLLPEGETRAVSIAFDRILGNLMNQTAITNLIKDANDDSPTFKNGGLFQNVPLQVGARYMMTVNVDTKDGLVNGATGYHKQIDYGVMASTSTSTSTSTNTNDTTRRKPLRLWIEFEDEKSERLLRQTQTAIRRRLTTADGGALPENWTLIAPYSSVVNQNYKSNIKLRRTQFPLCPAEYLTIHRSQGGTYDRVVVYNTAKTRLSRSLLYVACSRATKAEGLNLICKDNKFKPPTSLYAEQNSELRKEIQERMPTVSLNLFYQHLSTRSSDTQSPCFQIVSHNIQSLRRHIDQIVNDSVYLLSNILLFNETWTVANDQSFSILLVLLWLRKLTAILKHRKHTLRKKSQ